MRLTKHFVIAFVLMFLALAALIGGVTWYFVDAALQSPRRTINRSYVAPTTASEVIWAVVLIVLATIVAVGGFIWYMRRVLRGGTKLLAGGLPGTGLVLAMRDTGTTINQIYAVIEVRLRVSLAGRADYEAVAETMLGRMHFGAIQPGMTVNVRVDSADPQRVAIDLAAPAMPAPAQGATPAPHGTVTTPGGFFAVPGVAGNLRADKVRAAADVIAKGSKAEAIVQSVSHTGATAGQMVPGAKLDASVAEDPMIYLALLIEPRDGSAPFAEQGIHRVPRKLLGTLAIGKRIPVAYLPGDAGSATIDWSRLR